MPSKRALLAAVLLLGVAAVPRLAFAQYGGNGTGSALSNSGMMHQGFVQPGIDDLEGRMSRETPFRVLKDVETGMKDADPNVRVTELKKLRDLQDPKVNKILIRALSDPDIRVRMKAIDILGARGANEAVGPLSQMLFLRTTEPVVKLHVVAALGRIGDAAGALPVMQYLREERTSGDNPQDCGTAVFALGEIGSDSATPLLTKVIASDQSPMVRRLAREALEKIDGELPSAHAARLAQGDKKVVPTDQKLAKLRAFDQKVQAMER
jgi:HEAT repeat protein